MVSSVSKIKFGLVFSIILLITITNFHSTGCQDTSLKSQNLPNLDFTQLTIANDSSLIKFLNASQDLDVHISSMDDAYYFGKSLLRMNFLYSIPLPDEIEDIFQFLSNARNPDGGYGNWEAAKSSMESTSQAMELYYIFNKLSYLTNEQLASTWDFVLQMQDPSGAFLPLVNWTAPDITSTYRALILQDQLSDRINATLNYPASSIITYVSNNYVPPFYISDGSGYSEVTTGEAELIATSLAYQIFNELNYTDAHIGSVLKFLKSLQALSGGLSQKVTSLPTTGYTMRGLDLYFAIQSGNYTSANVSSVISTDFVEDALTFISSTKQANSGFTSSARDTTAGLSSTYFALESYYNAQENGFSIPLLESSEVFKYLVTGNQPSYGIGNYPGDIADIRYTVDAIKLARLLNNTSWINQAVEKFVYDTYDPNTGGFGFRIGARSRVKYTLAGIEALRLLGDGSDIFQDILSFILSSQNEDHGFGEQPASKISYLTHTFWAIQSLDQLQYEFSKVEKNDILSFLKYYQNYFGEFANFPGLTPSIVSTYRGYQLIDMLGGNITAKPIIFDKFQEYISPNGGFYSDTIDYKVTLEATYYGVKLAEILNIELNKTKILSYVTSLKNSDGGYAPNSGFSSRISSTLQAYEIMNLYEIPHENSMLEDYYAPIIESSFNPKTDTNNTVSGSYKISAHLKDRETNISKTWVDMTWTKKDGTTITQRIFGDYETTGKIWSYLLGPFENQGFVIFTLTAVDGSGNIAKTQENMFLTSDLITHTNEKLQKEILWLLLPIFTTISFIDGLLGFNKNLKNDKSDVKMRLLTKNENYSPIQSFNTFFLLLTVLTLIFVSRLFLGDAILVLQKSLFLFRFLLAALFILFARYVLGVKTFGFFGTSVLALSWINIGPLWGMLIFVNVFIIAYFVRRLIDPYNLPVGFRIAALMFTVVISLTILEILGEVFRIPILSTSILLPIIITPWMADRYQQEVHEFSGADAFVRFISTVIVVAGSYFFMNMDKVVSFILLNPEVWIIFFVIIIYGGRSRIYSRGDRKRFGRLFNKSDPPLAMLGRNRDYIARYNQSVLFPIINKFQLKEQFDAWQVPTAQVMSVITSPNEIPKIIDRLANDELFADGFVIKPSQSLGGKGIQVIKSVTPEGNFVIGDSTYAPVAIEDHIRKIIEGEFLSSQTLSQNDIALIEEKIVADDKFGSLGVGLADIRIIIFKGVPVMAMARIPTSYSGGLANLKQGAIGASISLIDGRIFRAEYQRNEVTIHPDTKKNLVGFQFDNWKHILAIGCLAQKSTGLGYAGVDLVIDKDNRVLVLEVNKRPGLEIQNINLKSILSRLEMIEKDGIDATKLSPLKSAMIGMEYASKWEADE